MMSLNMKLEETYPELGPCGGFTQMYACMCDLHQEAYMAEVAWVSYTGLIFLYSCLTAVDTIGNCQRLAFTVGVSQHMHGWVARLACA